jgi:hypothetical protein
LKNTIGIATAVRWLNVLGYFFQSQKQGTNEFIIKNKNNKDPNIPIVLINEVFLFVSDDKLSGRYVTITIRW